MKIKPSQRSCFSSSVQRLLAVIFLFFSLNNLQSQPLVEWSTVIGGTLNDIPEALQIQANGQYVIAGKSNSSDGNMNSNKGEFDVWVTLLDETGDLVWGKNYGGSADDYAMDIQSTSDGGYILVGGTASNDQDINENNGGIDVWILKLDADGILQWSKTFGGVGVDFGTSVQALTDGYIVAGCTGSAGDSGVSAGYGGNEYWVLKIDLNGNLVWEKTFGGSRHDAAKRIVTTDDGGFIVAGNSWSNDGDISDALGHSDVWVIKIDGNGNLIWDKNFGGDTPDVLNSLTKTTDGNFVFAGGRGEMDLVGNGFYGRFDEQAWVLKFSPTGQQIWSKTYGGEDYDRATSISPTMDGGYIIGSNIRSSNGPFSNHAGNEDILLIKTDSLGEEEWSQLIGGAENEIAESVLQTTDGGYLMLGFSNSAFVDTTFAKIGFEDWWIVKFSADAVSVNLGADQTVCENEVVILDATVSNCNNCTYLWSDGNTDPIRQIALSQTSMFSVTVTNENGLEGTDLITIFVSSPDYTLVSENVLCAGFPTGSANLTANGNSYAYVWSNGSTDSQISDIAAGTYTFTITDGNGCSASEEVIIEEPLPISIVENISEVDCHGNATGSIDLLVQGGTGGFDYEWAGGQETQDIYNLTAGGYTVTITDNNGCVKIQDWVVNQPPTIDIGASPFPTQCFESEDGGAILSINGGVGNFSYQWSHGAMTENLENVGSGTYTLTVTDGNLCQNSQTVEISSPSEIVIETTVQNASCLGNNDGSITTNISGGLGILQYQWNNNASTPNISQLSSGTYTLTVTDGNLCQMTTEVIVSQNNNLNISSQIHPITCFESEDASIDLSLSGGNGGYGFLWNTGEETEDIDNLSAGNYVVTVTDSAGCEVIELFTIDALDSISINAMISPIDCYGASNGMIETAALGGNGTFDYQWSNNIFTSSNPNLPAGNYTLTVTDFKGCEKVQAFEMTQPDSIIIIPTITEVSCYGLSDGAIDLWVEGGTGGFFIDWSSGANSGLPSGNYTITVTDLNNCSVVEEVFIPQPDSLTATFQTTNPTNGDDGSIITQMDGGTPPFNFNWNDGEWTAGEIFNLPGGTYDLMVTDANGCQLNESVFLEPLSTFEIENLQIFEIFPNPSNGTFFLKLEFEKREKIEITITNEWGQVIQQFLRIDNFILEKNTLPQIPSGVYFVKVKTENGVAVKKLLVQN